MTIRHDKRGMALPFVLGIVTFVIGVVATLISYAIFQSRLIAKNLESTETYINAVQSIDATIHIIMRDQNLDSTYLSNLANYMNVSITPYNDTVWIISSPSSATTSVTSYISGDTGAISVIDDQFIYTGLEPNFEQNLFINALNLISAYVPQFITANFPSVTPQTEFSSFAQIMSYIDSLSQFTNIAPTSISNLADPTVSGHWYVTGNLTIANFKNLTIPDGYLLFINGSLTMNRGSTLSGNVVVLTTVTINGQANTTQTIHGTVYAGGDINLIRKTALGTVSDPTFLISGGKITVGTHLTGYGFLLSATNDIARNDSVSIYGGVYPPSSNLDENKLSAYSSLDSSNFFDYALPVTLTDPESSGETIFKFTAPR